MDLVDWCSASILHVSLFAWPNHNTQKVRKSLQSVLADLFRFPVRFSQGNLEGKSEVKAGPFCWQAGTEVFLFLYFFPAADNAPQSRSWIQGTLWAVNCFRVVALELTMVVTSSDTGIMAIYGTPSWCPRVLSAAGSAASQVGQREGLPWTLFSKSLHGTCSLSLSDSMSCTYPPVLNCFVLPISSFVFTICNWTMADALGFRN